MLRVPADTREATPTSTSSSDSGRYAAHTPESGKRRSPHDSMAKLTLSQVSKRFRNVLAVDDVSLEVEDGEFLALLGPSGCGKTTVLRMIAGFERVSAGSIAFDDKTVSSERLHVPPEERHVGIVFQSYALWPHMDVADNVGYPLKVARAPTEVRRRRVRKALEMVGLADMEERRPSELSGGQRQRVALARCLVMEPSVVLLDEPLANLDVHLRAAMEDEFVDFHSKAGATMLYITHDQAEAMAMADRIAVMDRGRIVQVDTPRTIYREPASEMVADFIGQGAVVPGEVLSAAVDGHCAVQIYGERMTLRCRPGTRAGPVKIALRPEGLVLSESGLAGSVRRVVYRGGRTDVEIYVGDAGNEILLLSCGEAPLAGERVRLRIEDGWVVPRD